MESLTGAIKRLHEREMDGARRARVLSVEELVDLSQEDLLKLQENTTMALTKKCELDRYCSICLERMKDHVCVPCGHRYCGQCIAQVRAGGRVCVCVWGGGWGVGGGGGVLGGTHTNTHKHTQTYTPHHTHTHTHTQTYTPHTHTPQNNAGGPLRRVPGAHHAEGQVLLIGRRRRRVCSQGSFRRSEGARSKKKPHNRPQTRRITQTNILYMHGWGGSWS